MRSGNPVLSDRALQGATSHAPPGPATDRTGAPAPPTEAFSVEGVIYKTAFLLGVVVLTAAAMWTAFEPETAPMPGVGVVFFTLIGLAVATFFRPRWAIVTGPLYALVSGAFIGLFSLVLEAQFPGIAMQAGVATLATAGGMLVAYRTGLIRVTEQFRKVVITATIGVMLFYGLNIVMAWVGIGPMGVIWGAGWLGIGFSLFVVGLAALNLVLDFDLIQRLDGRAEARMEWFGAFALTVTLVWLYIEMLRLISKLRQ